MDRTSPSTEEINRIVLRHVGRYGQLTEEINGIALRGTRLIRGLTQVGLARKAGISQPYLCRMESGAQRYVGLEVYASLVAALGVGYDDLLKHDDTADAA